MRNEVWQGQTEPKILHHRLNLYPQKTLFNYPEYFLKISWIFASAKCKALADPALPFIKNDMIKHLPINHMILRFSCRNLHSEILNHSKTVCSCVSYCLNSDLRRRSEDWCCLGLRSCYGQHRPARGPVRESSVVSGPPHPNKNMKKEEKYHHYVYGGMKSRLTPFT